MCGICGMFSLSEGLNPAVGASLEPMTDAIQHRGPDGAGYFRDRVAALGHRRLAIIDRAGGQQPMGNEGGSIQIVFNGEIYNHHPLRKTLIGLGHQFKTHSDTETIIHAYEEYGAACVDRLDGMFAFAIYDQGRREFFAARDRLGKKPFYYALLGNVLHFASEIKAFYRSPLWNGALNTSGLQGYFSLGYSVAPQTIYRDVLTLMPGHWLQISNGQLRTQQYWDVTVFEDDPSSESSVLERLNELLSEAVHSRLESEVPLGTFLSGGIDSGLVASYANDPGAQRMTTVSVGFSSQAHNELDAAGATASHLGTRHFAHVIEPNLQHVLDRAVSAFDEPFADASSIPTFYVSQFAREHVTVALSGDGGDEAFAGYSFRYVPHVLESYVRSLTPGRPARLAFGTVGKRWPRSPRLPRALRVGSLLENLGRDAADAYFMDLCFLKPDEVARLLGMSSAGLRNSPVYHQVTDPYRRCPAPDALTRAQYADLKVYMPNDPLVKVDRMSMQHGLEVRCPLLDRQVIEFAFRLPARLRMPRLQSKHLLRTLAQRRLPPEIVGLPKKGFTAPVGEWLGSTYREWFEADVFDRNSYCSTVLDVAHVRRRLDEHRLGRADHSYLLWSVWMLERWSKVVRSSAAVAAVASV